MANTTNQFDFKAYNELVRNAGSGLKLHLAIQMLKDVDYVMYRYENPLSADVKGCINDLIIVKDTMKKQAAERAAKTE